MKHKFSYVFLLLIVVVGFSLIYYFSQEKDCMFTVRNYLSGKTTIISRGKDCKELKGILDKTKSNTPLQISDDIYGTKYVIEANTNNTKAYYMPLGNILHVHVVENNKDNKILLDEWYPLEEKDYDRIEEIIQSNYYFSQEKDCMFTVRNYVSGETTIISRDKDCKELKGILDKTKSNTPLQISDDIYGTKYVIEANTNNTKAYYMPLGNILHVHVVENNKDNKILLDEWYPLEEKDYDRIEEIIQSNYYFSQEKDCMFTVRNYVSGETTIISRDKDCKELKGILDKTKSNTPLQISDDIYGTKYVIEANTNNTKAYYMPLGNILHVHVVEKSKDNKILLDEWYPLEEKDYDRIEEIIQSNLRSEKPSSNF